MLYNKPRSHIETVNDLDGNVVNLFEWIRQDPERLAREIYLTPYARQVYNAAFETEPVDSFERAVNFYIRLNMGYGFRTNGERVGWKNDVQGRERAYASQDWCNLPGKIMQAAERLRGVQIENMPAVELIQRFNHPNVLIYADRSAGPPEPPPPRSPPPRPRCRPRTDGRARSKPAGRRCPGASTPRSTDGPRLGTGSPERQSR